MKWSKREMDWYNRALNNNYYPQNVINFIKRKINKRKTIIDVGSGIGTFAIPLTNIFSKVIAVDYSEKMLKYLYDKAVVNNVEEKIKIKTGDWNKIKFKDESPINSLITAYSGKEVVGNKDSIKKMQHLVDDYIFLFVPGERKKHSFSSDKLFEMLGRKKRKHRCCYLDVENMLDEFKIDYNKTNFVYNFGQPFESFEEGIEFFKFHYKVKDNNLGILKNFLRDFLKEKGDFFWIDNNKKSTMYYWKMR